MENEKRNKASSDNTDETKLYNPEEKYYEKQGKNNNASSTDGQLMNERMRGAE
ncbi:hypothetical protein [Virgibacillus ndiopensis]|uniref:hypothetical protein n=1 Tax=Virgibacillus ndiopensis TaxID=2004408 RepID=UPI00159B8535|nr:hypothetical protein [Virgibacillus ndiopensis]